MSTNNALDAAAQRWVFNRLISTADEMSNEELRAKAAELLKRAERVTQIISQAKSAAVEAQGPSSSADSAPSAFEGRSL